MNGRERHDRRRSASNNVPESVGRHQQRSSSSASCVHGPSARASSGLDAHTHYQEIPSVPVTSSNIRACRGAGALKGFFTSTGDADGAYLQVRLDSRPTTAGTWVALPRSFLAD